MKPKEDIVITGIGVVSPIGVGKDPFWNSLCEGRSGVRPLDLYEQDAVTNAEEIMRLKTAAQQVHVEPSLRRYLLDIVRETRHLPDIELGASPRASLALFHATQALALSCGRDFVMPDDIKRLAPSVLSHRLIASTEAYLHHRSKESLIENILDRLPVPVEPQTEPRT